MARSTSGRTIGDLELSCRTGGEGEGDQAARPPVHRIPARASLDASYYVGRWPQRIGPGARDVRVCNRVDQTEKVHDGAQLEPVWDCSAPASSCQIPPALTIPT